MESFWCPVQTLCQHPVEPTFLVAHLLVLFTIYYSIIYFSPNGQSGQFIDLCLQLSASATVCPLRTATILQLSLRFCSNVAFDFAIFASFNSYLRQ